VCYIFLSQTRFVFNGNLLHGPDIFDKFQQVVLCFKEWVARLVGGKLRGELNINILSIYSYILIFMLNTFNFW
jgi:hypothetical protein